jgi:hypothetical protein
VPDTFWLSCHADYACRHSGACCRAGWPLPVESRVVAAIDTAVASGRVPTVDGSVVWLQETAEAPDGMAGTFRLAGGACVFHVARTPVDEGSAGGRHCAVHATLGHDALPSSCQHFPRVCLMDGRGVRVALSHFCPTAAAMLVDATRPVTVVAGPDAVPGGGVPEGLDARDALPPRLSDRVLMDLDALTAWEAHVVNALAGPSAWPGAVEDVLSRLAAQADVLARWTPGSVPLVDVIRAFEPPSVGADGDAPTADTRAAWTPEAAWALGQDACRAPWTWPALPANLAALDARWVAPAWPYVAPVVRRYLAGRAFGAWVTYQADATRGLASWLALALTVLRVECARACAEGPRPLDRERLVTAVRQADLLLVHYADSAGLAAGLSPR